MANFSQRTSSTILAGGCVVSIAAVAAVAFAFGAIEASGLPAG